MIGQLTGQSLLVMKSIDAQTRVELKYFSIITCQDSSVGKA